MFYCVAGNFSDNTILFLWVIFVRIRDRFIYFSLMFFLLFIFQSFIASSQIELQSIALIILELFFPVILN